MWISLTKEMQKLQQQQMQLVEAAVRHKRKAAEQEERAIEIGKSISQPRMRLTNTAKESEAKVLDEKSLDFADEETKKAPQTGTCCGQASGRNRGGNANTASEQWRRRRSCRWKTRKRPPDEVKRLLAKVLKKAEQRVYLARPGAEPKEPKLEDEGKLDTRKFLFQNLTSFGHKARTWLLSDQMEIRHHGSGGTSFGRAQCGRGGGAPASGRIPLDLDTCQANWTRRNQWENGDDQTTLEILQVLGR